MQIITRVQYQSTNGRIWSTEEQALKEDDRESLRVAFLARNNGKPVELGGRDLTDWLILNASWLIPLLGPFR